MQITRLALFFVVVNILFIVPSFAQGDPKTYLQSLGYSLSSSDLSRGLLDARPGVRASSASEIGELGYKDDLDALQLAVSREQNEDVLFSMLASSQQLGLEEAKVGLRKLCLSKDEGLQIKTANYLQYLGDNSCAESVAQQLKSPYAGIREGALLYLSHIKKQLEPPSASLGPLLIEVIRDDSYKYNVELALQVVGQIGDANTQAGAKRIRRH